MGLWTAAQRKYKLNQGLGFKEWEFEGLALCEVNVFSYKHLHNLIIRAKVVDSLLWRMSLCH